MTVRIGGPGSNPITYQPPGTYNNKANNRAADPVDSTKLADLPGRGEVSWELPHVPQARHLPLLRGGKLSRGFIVQDKGDPAVAQNPHGKPLGLRFLYNPTTVQVSYSINTDIYPANDAPGGAVPLLGVPGSATVGFDLILDRTLDVWKNPASRGIREDVEQFQKMLGYTAATPYIQPVGMFVVFGNTLLKYYGFIQSFSILYTNWTQAMVPYRGALSGLTMQVLPNGKVKKVQPITSPNNYQASGGDGGGGGGAGGGGGKRGGKGDGSGRGGNKDPDLNVDGWSWW